MSSNLYSFSFGTLSYYGRNQHYPVDCVSPSTSSLGISRTGYTRCVVHVVSFILSTWYKVYQRRTYNVLHTKSSTLSDCRLGKYFSPLFFDPRFYKVTEGFSSWRGVSRQDFLYREEFFIGKQSHSSTYKPSFIFNKNILEKW